MVKYLLTDTVGYNCLLIKGLATAGYCFNISFRHPFLSLVKSTSNVKFLILVIIYELEKLRGGVWGGEWVACFVHDLARFQTRLAVGDV